MDDNFVLDRIEELCKKKGYSHYRLSMKSGVHQSSLSTLMKRKSTPNVYTLDKICKGLGITLGQFFTVDDEFASLTDEQKDIVHMWNSMGDVDKKVVIAFMKGITAKAEEPKKEL